MAYDRMTFICLFLPIGDKANLEQLDKIAPAFEKPTISKDAKQKSIKIQCRCKGKQEPKIIWKKDKTEIKDTPNKYKISKTKEADDIYIFILEILVREFIFHSREFHHEIFVLFRMQVQLIQHFTKS